MVADPQLNPGQLVKPGLMSLVQSSYAQSSKVLQTCDEMLYQSYPSVWCRFLRSVILVDFRRPRVNCSYGKYYGAHFRLFSLTKKASFTISPLVYKIIIN